MDKRFVLRHAAGTYWLIDLKQDPTGYKDPMSFNETGATVLGLLEEGKSAKQIAGTIADRYGSKPDEALEDILSFELQLMEYGYKINN
ncbi:MAG: PqqD family protein [Lachnospiraceae bacterium]|nr:PqqD family protein [Lachnospiraceae bacterium]